ncbi:MAG: tetratricopeptide repeat protein [Acidobacteria bacterium]|nr:tetratricopeptide repeat protein [Acidobacteriota bacterium]
MEQALGLAVFSGIVGHFLSVQFSFSTVGTSTYFWVYAGLLVALTRRATNPEAAVADTNGPPPAMPAYVDASVLGLIVAVMLITLTTNLVSPTVTMTSAGVWIFVLVWSAGLGAVWAVASARPGGSGKRQASVRAGALAIYAAASLGGGLFHALIHGFTLSRWQSVTTPDAVAATTAWLANDVVVYIGFLTMVTAVMATVLTWSRAKDLPSPRRARIAVYLPCALVIGGVIWLKNVDVIRADVYLKEAERYQQSGRYEAALVLHEHALSLDSDEAFYDHRLAVAQQAVVMDVSVESGARELARARGERAVLDARRLNPYGPSEVSNLGRFYLGLALVVDADDLEHAIAFLQDGVALAPFDADVRQLLAHAHYVRGETQAAIDQLQRSLAFDDGYFPTWSLLAEILLDIGDVSPSLEAVKRALLVGEPVGEGFQAFFRQGFDRRVLAYAAVDQGGSLVDTILDAAGDRTLDGLVPWAVGRAYTLQGERREAVPYYEEALSLLERTVQLAPLDVEARTRLADTYRGVGRLPEALRTLGNGRENAGREAFVRTALDIGVAFANRDLHAQAADTFERALAADDRSFAAQKNLGMMYFYLDRPGEGIAHFETAAALDPENADTPLLRQIIAEYGERSPPPAPLTGGDAVP